MSDVVRVIRAIATNQLARVAPSAYVRLTGQTGRGPEDETAADIVRYFLACVDDYAKQLGLGEGAMGEFLNGKVLLEYGPGDVPGVAALMVARGARKVYCVDRFPLVRLSGKNAKVVADLAEAQEAAPRARLLGALRDSAEPALGFKPECIEYLVTPSGLSGLKEAVDLVYSRAVLEHVNDLEASFSDMVAAMKPGALAIHQVDLRSHGLHRQSPLDFLTWSPRLWSLMYSEKGVPNRWRIDHYRQLLTRLPVDVLALQPTAVASAADVAKVREALATPFRKVSDEDLACLGFWLIFRKRAD